MQKEAVQSEMDKIQRSLHYISETVNKNTVKDAAQVDATSAG